MHSLKFKLINKTLVIIAITTFFSCDDSSTLLKQINTFNENPVGIAYNINMT